jgi:glycerol-3-phosphate dehydrogenase
MKNTVTADIVIFGGGIAGLWLLHRLRQSGYSAILFESGVLGGGQTHKAQGIIHGGMKYALQGIMTKEAMTMADMPAFWQNCLEGKGEIDLSHVPILSPRHYLWSPTKFAAKLTGMMASATLSSKVGVIPKEEYPTAFQNAEFKGEVYALDEMVIDVASLVRELVKENQDAVYKIEPLAEDGVMLDAVGNLESATVYMAGKPLHITAQHFVFAAGAGNEVILKKLKTKEVAMQRRPLHMVLAKMPFDHKLYAHCLGFGPRPRITITSHPTQDGKIVWYLGGQLAEDGVGRDRDQQIKAAREELNSLFPWLDFVAAEFATFTIDRAEPLQKSGLKPETSYTKVIGNMTIAWPTKLALAPKLAAEISDYFTSKKLQPANFDLRELRAWPMPPLSKPIWETAFCKSGE